ncbi:uncharacterized protein EV422DRAFT_545674 [Fimicolochytrium jonesii]|uniref:uncharacterized protein n=1 Tax=Fimicolochytrium jonesii TaxID=1396493 RepID=UPI0022FE67F7|nr:uncharacterized protein EV422DRAFT_545674 [Fimicolochytrium jonesii]KAI8816545.1 hypothetical protein EV422DRAFT_545674 [Fimicolochytrium jonesii]
MTTYNAPEPTVIDEDLLRKSVNDQAAPEIADVARREGIDFGDVGVLRLDYKNILKIDNLYLFQNLTKLQLDNNIIEKIEKIEFLKNLTWLDLSFNNITKIEGLAGLTKLTDLTLYNNRIARLEGLDDLVNLNVLSVGNNLLTELENVTYLSKFSNLRVLNLSGNTICKLPNFRHYILAHIRGLRYLDYRLVDDESVKAAKEQYIDDIIAQEEEDKIVAARREEERRERELAELYEASHIPSIDTLFPSLFASDPDFLRLEPIITLTPFTELRAEYEGKVMGVLGELKSFVLKRSEERRRECEMFRECLREACRKVDEECWGECKRVGAEKKRTLLALTQSPAHEIPSLLSALRSSLSALSDTLLTHEMTLVEQFEEVHKEFERNYTELASSVSETAASAFARLRECENEFQERLSEAVQSGADRLIKGEGAAQRGEEGGQEIEEDLRDIISDKDILVNLINSTHDFRLAKFDHQEDTLVSGTARDLEHQLAHNHETELARNRARICEVCAFLEKCAAEVDAAEEGVY